MNETPQRKWLGPLLSFFLPGSAHWLSGRKRTGWTFLVLSHGLPILALNLMLIGNVAAIRAGLALTSLGMLAVLASILTAWRPQPRPTGKGAGLFVGAIVALAVVKSALSALLPAEPFSVPSNNMAPTLFGTRAVADENGGLVLRAKASGTVENIQMENRRLHFTIGETEHVLPAVILANDFHPAPRYEEGEVIWSGEIFRGDHIVANRFAYRREAPRRGDIVVFSTDGIDHADVRAGVLYTQRVVGLPGETVSLREGALFVNDASVESPAIFAGCGYRNGGLLADAENAITLGEDEYLTLGDNTAEGMSLDGRFFGPISRDAIRARVSAVYWPLDRVGAVK